MDQNYKDYLLSDKWREKRHIKLTEAEFRCNVCNSDYNLQIHHKTYERIYNEDLNDLVVLCNDCHFKFHKKLKGVLEKELEELVEELTSVESAFWDAAAITIDRKEFIKKRIIELSMMFKEKYKYLPPILNGLESYFVKPIKEPVIKVPDSEIVERPF